jgi:hypothetical protein
MSPDFVGVMLGAYAVVPSLLGSYSWFHITSAPFRGIGKRKGCQPERQGRADGALYRLPSTPPPLRTSSEYDI